MLNHFMMNRERIPAVALLVQDTPDMAREDNRTKQRPENVTVFGSLWHWT